MSTLFDFLLLLLGFGLVIFVHELGHFAVAKWVGIKVEQFAIGFGPAFLAWRKGVGVRPSTTAPEYERLLASGVPVGQLGETEYRLNYFPLGGYVKMLGQEDLDMAHATPDPRSYSSKPIWARMCVVSAGVVMNVLFAIVLFIICFMWGVKYVPPVIGNVLPDSAAALALPRDAERLGIVAPGLAPGDTIVAIDGKSVDQFSDVQIAAALAKPGQTLLIDVRRDDEILRYEIKPRHDRATDLLAIGVVPSQSNVIAAIPERHRPMVQGMLERAGLGHVELREGMILAHVDGRPISALWELSRAIDESDGRPIELTFIDPSLPEDDPRSVQRGTITPDPDMMLAQVRHDDGQYAVNHVLGLTPALRVMATDFRGDAPDLREGDLIVRIGDIDWPREDQLNSALRGAARSTVTLTVQREGERHEATLRTDRFGYARFHAAARGGHPPVVAAPLESREVYGSPDHQHGVPIPLQGRGVSHDILPAADLNLMPGTRILRINDESVETWRELQLALRAATRPFAPGSAGGWPDATISITYQLPNPAWPPETVEWTIPGDTVQRLHTLEWHSQLSTGIFSMLEETMRAGGPIHAVRLGMERTWDMLVLTYATLDRLIRGTVSVQQLKGPVGIAEIGTRVAGQGLPQLIMFLGIISVNLAVLNFLPIPIVDGGLMVFLIVEKIKGSPVSIRVQNAATIVGLALIGSIFIITFYNDVLNLIHGLAG